MKRLSWFLLLPLLALFGAAGAGQQAQYDLVIRNGRIVDGSGAPAAAGAVAVREGRIVAVGDVAGRGREEIDARGQVIAPGFIDVHAHAESVENGSLAENFVHMGVTTIVTGNCGRSTLEVENFFRSMEEHGVSINVATLVGHNSVRREAMGGEFDRDPTPTEQTRMQGLVERALTEGAVGLSTGLLYLPGTFAKTEEVVDLARVVAARNGIYVSHMRDESSRFFESLEEVIQVAREAEVRAQVSHIKLFGNVAWGRAGEALARLEQVRAEGVEITQDQYMYPASSTGITRVIPARWLEGGMERYRERVATPEGRAALVADMKELLRITGREEYDYVQLANYAHDPSLNGLRIPEVTQRQRGAATVDDQIAMIIEIHENGGASCVYHAMNEEDLQTFLRHPNTMIASDSGVRRGGPDAEGFPHPRGMGNAARALGRYVRELQLLTLEDAVRKMTSLPAERFRLPQRGLLREGSWADIVVFDPDAVRDNATFEDPHQYASGFSHVFVNGVAVLRDGEHTEARPGQAARRGN